MSKKTLEGKVVSDKMDKTVVVKVDSKVKHPLYKKYIVKSKKYMVHDDDNIAKMGDWVKIIENKPISKNKTWTLFKQQEGK